MGKKKFPILKDNEWVRPIMKKYGMKCCDCGLVHKFDFRVVEIMKRHKDGTATVQTASSNYEILLKAKRIKPKGKK